MKPSILTQKTIACILGTRRGTLYQLSDHNRKHLPITAVRINLIEFLDKGYIFELLAQKEISFKKYLNLESYQNYLTLYNPTAKTPILGTSKSNTIKLCLRNEYKEFEIKDIMGYMELCQPDILVSPSENVEPLDSGITSNKRAILKNLQFLEKSIDRFRALGTSSVIAPIIATKYHNLLMEGINQMEGLQPDGYVIQGLYQGESFEQRNTIYSKIREAFGGDSIKRKSVVLSSVGEPCDVLHAIYYGIYLFESEYPFTCAERGYALGFDLQSADFKELDKGEDTFDTSIFSKGLVARYLDLNNQSHKESMGPLIEKCECYTCKNHSRAYIHHLLDSEDMTANVLLTIHNVFTYQKLIETLKSYVVEDRINEFIKWFMENQCMTSY